MRKKYQFAAFVAASLMLGCGFTGAAAEARVISGNDTALSAENVDAQRPMTLTVRKVAKNPFDDVPVGDKPAAIAGAVFTLSRVNGVDVLTAAGREEAKNFTVDKARERGLTEVAKRTTNAEGVAEFTDLKAGLYLLEESAPDGEHNYHLSSPKLIILPLGNVTGEEFDYENVIVTKPDNHVPPSTTTTTTPGVPPETDTPVPPPTTTGTITTTENTPPTESAPVPPETEPSQPPTDGGWKPPLASTGANVLWAVGLGALLVIAGFFLARRARGKQTH